LVHGSTTGCAIGAAGCSRRGGNCSGFLHAAGYAGFDRLYRPTTPGGESPLVEVACWSHARRKLYDVHHATVSPIALDVNPQTYLADVLIRIADHPIRQNRRPAPLALVKVARAGPRPTAKNRGQRLTLPCVNYAGAYTAYGPIRPGADGLTFYTLRDAFDPGARFLPEYKKEHRMFRS
jgi:hypothetical protein